MPVKRRKTSKTTTRKHVKRVSKRKSVPLKSHKRVVQTFHAVHKKPPIIKTYTETIITPAQPIIYEDKTIELEKWNNIRKICESGIKFYRDYHQYKPCDGELARKLNQIESYSKSNHVIDQINHILRSRQTQIDKLRQIYRYANKKLN